MKKMKQWLPLIVTAVLTAWFLGTLVSPTDSDFNFSEFGKLPLVSTDD